MVRTTTERRRTKTPNSNRWAPIAKRGREMGPEMRRRDVRVFNSFLADDAPQRISHSRAKALLGRIGHERFFVVANDRGGQ